MEDYPRIGSIDGKEADAALPGHVYMDAMGFGMGLCCLQLTFQASYRLLPIKKRRSLSTT